MERTITIDPPFEGYEKKAKLDEPIVGDFVIGPRGNPCRADITYLGCSSVILTPIRKVFGWGKVDGDVWVINDTSNPSRFKYAINSAKSIELGWQHHGFSDKCPIDMGSSIISARMRDGSIHSNFSLSSNPDWGNIAGWRFESLIDGVDWFKTQEQS